MKFFEYIDKMNKFYFKLRLFFISWNIQIVNKSITYEILHSAIS